jgi:diguanylate cyclase (GGDEF)-like protein
MPHRSLTTNLRRVLSDPERLRVLGLTGLMDSESEAHMDRWAQVAAEALDAPVALISLVDHHRQFFKSTFGPADRANAERYMALTHSFCQHVVADGRVLAIEDARLDAALCTHDAIADLDVVAYAGAAIRVSGHALGALCVIEPTPRAWSAGELRLLGKLAKGLGYEIQLRIAIAEQARSNELSESHNRIHELIAGDHPLPRILEAIVTSIEMHDPDLLGEILLLHPDGRTLHQGAARRLPASYRNGIDGLPVGTCGAAAASGKEVICRDLREDARWDDHLHLAEAAGLRHCWSFPVVRSDGTVEGALVVYGTRPRSPNEGDRRFLRDAANLAGVAIERRRSHDRLVFDATHDALTGLVNRTTATDRLDDVLLAGVPARGAVSVLSIDLDRLKIINDLLGHDTGDDVLRQAASRLHGCTEPADLVACLGGDEFLIVSVGDDRHAVDLAERALAALRIPLAGPPHGQELEFSASVGITVITDRDVDARQAIRRANGALHAAKSRGGNQYAFGDATDSAAMSRRLAVENALRHALEHEELRLVYQPLQRFADGHFVAVEALARWGHPQLGQVGPDEFIPIAEQSGLINDIGAWVLSTACASLHVLDAAYGHPMQLGINVSTQQLRDPALPTIVDEALRSNRLSADRLYVEITETALLASDDITKQTIDALDAMGVRIALDDFGAGYSSLAILKRHPISAIKIDRSFITGLPHDRDNLAIVTALAAMGEDLGLSVVAEGIETHDEYDALLGLGCQLGQGYLIGRPAPAPWRNDGDGRSRATLGTVA